MDIVTKIGSRIVVKSIWQKGENSWMLQVEVGNVAQVAFPTVAKGAEEAIQQHTEAVEFIGRKWAEGTEMGNSLFAPPRKSEDSEN